MDVRLRFFWLVPATAAFLIVVGVFRVAEVGADIALRLAGIQQPGLPIVVAALILTAIGVVALLVRRRMRRSNWSYLYSQPSGEQLTEDELKRLEEMAALESMNEEGLPLDRVLALGRTINASGVFVELIAIEVRVHIARLIVAVRDPEGSARERELFSGHMGGGKMPDPEALPTLLHPVIGLSDDVETNYRVWLGSAGGSSSDYRCEFYVVPTIPDNARMLTIDVERLTNDPDFPLPGRGRAPRVIDGPWRVEIDLTA